jgi:malate dehydrogenase (oxaloacetate-decarboxylating)(NADP+)
VLRAAQVCQDEGLCQPILLGPVDRIRARAAEIGVDLVGIEIIDPMDPQHEARLSTYAQHLWERRQRRGTTLEKARHLLRQRTPFALMMVELADPTVNIQPNAECLAQIAVSTAEACKWFDIEPRIAMLSYSNFGSAESEDTRRVAQAVQLVKRRQPGLVIDGEMQVDTALDAALREEFFPFTALSDNANVLIFPDLASGNVAYKLMGKLGGAELVGPILLGMRKPVNVLQRGCDVNTIVNMAALTAVRAQGGIGS